MSRGIAQVERGRDGCAWSRTCGTVCLCQTSKSRHASTIPAAPAHQHGACLDLSDQALLDQRACSRRSPRAADRARDPDDGPWSRGCAISTVAPRPPAGVEGRGPAGRNAAHRARGVRGRTRHLDRGPRAGTHLARRRRARGRRRRRRRRHGGIRQPGRGGDRCASSSRSSSAARRPRSHTSGSRCTAATLNIGRRGVVAARDQRRRHRALGPASGKQLGVPVYELLGGKLRTLAAGVRELAVRDRGPRCAGRRGRRVGGAGLHGGEAAPAVRPARGEARGSRRNVELVRTVVDAVGPDVDVMADAYMSWDVGYAIRCIRGNRGRGDPAALDRGAGRSPTTSRGSRASAPRSRRRSPPASTRRPATDSATSSRPARSTCSSRT